MDPDGQQVPPVGFNTFDECPFPAEVLDEVKRNGFVKPSPIQMYSWPLAVQGKDIIGIATTGSGKTVAFLFPAFKFIIETKAEAKDPTLLCLSPTRELAVQVENEAHKFGRDAGIVTVCVYGGVGNKRDQGRDLAKGCHVVVGTPGRLNDFVEGKELYLSNVSKLVVDEADRMLDMGFEPQIRKAVREVKEKTERQTLFFTATWNSNVQKIAAEFVNNPFQVKIGSTEHLKASDTIKQIVKIVDPDKKVRHLTKLFLEYDISEKGRGENRAMIFCNTKKTCEQLEDGLNRARVRCDSIHGDKEQKERERALNDLRDGYTKIICATDVAARGLDVKGVTLVINYDPPKNAEDYVHRIGRTGRAGHSGTAVTFLTDRDDFQGRQIRTVMLRNNQEVPRELQALVDGTLPRRRRSRSNRRRSRSRRGGRSQDRRRRSRSKRRSPRRSRERRSRERRSRDRRSRDRGDREHRSRERRSRSRDRRSRERPQKRSEARDARSRSRDGGGGFDQPAPSSQAWTPPQSGYPDYPTQTQAAPAPAYPTPQPAPAYPSPQATRAYSAPQAAHAYPPQTAPAYASHYPDASAVQTYPSAHTAQAPPAQPQYSWLKSEPAAAAAPHYAQPAPHYAPPAGYSAPAHQWGGAPQQAAPQVVPPPQHYAAAAQPQQVPPRQYSWLQ